MPRGHSVKTYTQSAVAKWKKDVGDLPAAIQVCEQKIKDAKVQIAYQKKQALPFENQLSVINQDIEALTAQINVLTLPAKIKELEQKRHIEQQTQQMLVVELDAVNKILAAIHDQIAVLDVNIEYLRVQDQLTQLSSHLAQQQSALEASQETLTRLNSQKHALSKNTSAIEDRLSFLHRQEIQQNDGYSSSVNNQSAGGYSSSANSGASSGYSSSASSGYSSTNQAQPRNDIKHAAEIADLHVQLDQLYRQMNDLGKDIESADRESQRLSHSTTRLRSQISADQIRLVSLAPSATRSGTPIYQLQAERDRQLALKVPQDQKHRQLESDIQRHANAKDDLQRHINSHQATYTRALLRNEKYASHTNVSALETSLSAQNTERKRLHAEKKPFDDAIASKQAECGDSEQNLGRLRNEETIHNNNTYLHELTYQPEQLFEKLKSNISTQISEYEEEHLGEQSWQVRSTLLTLQRKIQYIDNMNLEVSHKYTLLCGMLWTLYQQHENDKTFANYLLNILGDESLDETECCQKYATLVSLTQQLQDLNQYQVFELEKQAYMNAAQALQAVIAQCPENAPKEIKNLFASGHGVLDAINTKVNHIIKHQESGFNIKYHTELLNNTRAVIMNPENQSLINRQEKLASQNCSGKSSLCEKIIGSLLIVAGAALACVSAGFGYFTLGLGSPLSIAGMAGGGAMITTGAGLIWHGREKGIYKAQKTFIQSSLAASPFSMWQQPRPPAQSPEYDKSKTDLLYPPSAPPLYSKA